MRALVLGLLLGAAAGSEAFACASCGAGGDDPLVLYPNELNKFYFSASRATGFRNVDADGDLASSGGPTAKDTLVLAAGRTLSPRGFVTATVPFLRNARDGDAKTAIGDPSLGGRYAIVLQSLAQPWLPQVQGLVAYKHAQARSLRESEDLRTLLDVFGTGFSELRAGVDVWYGMAAVKAGAAHVASVSRARDFDGVRYEPGASGRTTLTLGYGWTSGIKTLVGANRERKDGLTVDGERQRDSDQLSHGLFVTQDLLSDAASSVRMTLARQAAFGGNRNTARASTATLAYARAF